MAFELVPVGIIIPLSFLSFTQSGKRCGLLVPLELPPLFVRALKNGPQIESLY